MEPPDGSRDVIEHGRERDRLERWRAWAGRRPAVLAVAVLAVGLIAGYLAGHQHSRPPAAPPTARASATASATAGSAQPATLDLPPALTATGNRCAVQSGTMLQLGIEVANQSPRPVAVGSFRAVLPIGGLRATGIAVGTCGALPNGAPGAVTLPPGATEWLTITFQVLVRCPQAYPVQFQVSYTGGGRSTVVQLDEFPDLGQVAYSGCGTS